MPRCKHCRRRTLLWANPPCGARVCFMCAQTHVDDGRCGTCEDAAKTRCKEALEAKLRGRPADGRVSHETGGAGGGGGNCAC